MRISNNYIAVVRIEKPETEGFKTVEVQDDFVYKGKVVEIPEAPIHMGNQRIGVGDTILFAKYSPDTHEIEVDGQKIKFVSTRDILASL